MDSTRSPLPVVLLTRAGCGLCDEAATLLERLAAEYPLSVATLDFESAEGQALAEQTGILYVPGVVIEGEAVAEGRISAKTLRREIERRTGRAPARSERRGTSLRSIYGWLTRSW